VAEVAARLGHSSGAFTLRQYSHAVPDRAEGVARLADELLEDSSVELSVELPASSPRRTARRLSVRRL
jgi:hypothetical protein